jgi:hypothetical protein
MRLARTSGSGLGAAAVLSGLAAVAVFGGLGGEHALRASDLPRSQHLPPTWHAVETANFRILSYGSRPADLVVGEACEAVRKQLVARWHAELGGWTPKCEVVLHPTRDAYLREVGASGRDTLGSAVVDRRDGGIRSRRIDICATGGDWTRLVLAHEMTHVVLADRFAGHAVPRWVDEGAAILADPRDKQGRHRQDLARAQAGRDTFRVCELMALADYPPPHRWGAFYGQSASLVQFLVEQQGEADLMAFVEASLANGYEGASRQVYTCGLAELEQRWQSRVRGKALAKSVAPNRVTRPHAPQGLPVSLAKP